MRAHPIPQILNFKTILTDAEKNHKINFRNFLQKRRQACRPSVARVLKCSFGAKIGNLKNISFEVCAEI